MSRNATTNSRPAISGIFFLAALVFSGLAGCQLEYEGEEVKIHSLAELFAQDKDSSRDGEYEPSGSICVEVAFDLCDNLPTNHLLIIPRSARTITDDTAAALAELWARGATDVMSHVILSQQDLDTATARLDAVGYCKKGTLSLWIAQAADTEVSMRQVLMSETSSRAKLRAFKPDVRLVYLNSYEDSLGVPQRVVKSWEVQVKGWGLPGAKLGGVSGTARTCATESKPLPLPPPRKSPTPAWTTQVHAQIAPND